MFNDTTCPASAPGPGSVHLLTPRASGFIRKDETFDRARFEQVVIAFLADPYWGADHGRGVRGYGMDVLAFNRARYEAATVRPAAPEWVDYGS